MSLVTLVVLASLTSNPEPQKVGVSVGAMYLGAPGANGAAATAGVRLAMGRHFALGFDLGWGVVATETVVHDRWWLMPTAAFVIPLGRVRIDVGAGLGFATASGYDSMDQFLAAPFTPVWAFQLVPAARGHVMVAVTLSQRVDVFLRADAGTLLLQHQAIGFRDNNPNPTPMDTMWFGVNAGVTFGLL